MRCGLMIFLMACLSHAAQAQSYHEFSLNGGAGLSSLQYSPASGGQKPGLGFSVGAGYYFFFTPQWGVGTGLHFTSYNASTTLRGYSESSDERTAVNGANDFIFTYTYHTYEERQHSSMLTIPLMLQFQTRGYTSFYVAMGAKVGIPLVSNYSARGNYSTEGYFPNTNTRYDSLYSYGFGNYSLDEEKVAMKLKMSFSLAVEMGAKFYLNDWILYVGGYADYGLNDIRKDRRQAPLVGYEPETPWNHAYASVLNMSDRLRTLSAGLTVRITIPFISSGPQGGFNRGMVVPTMAPATNRLKR